MAFLIASIAYALLKNCHSLSRGESVLVPLEVGEIVYGRNEITWQLCHLTMGIPNEKCFFR
jgi:hypothetical protein